MENLLSIIVPVYNLEQYIEKTTHNLLSQSYSPYEIVIVDDGSTDHSAQILDRLASEHPEHLRVLHIPNGGVTNARLTGVRAAKGNWIAFVDGDDAIEPNMFSILMDNAIAHKADISHCGYYMVFPSRRVPYHGSKQLLVSERDDALLQLLKGDLVEPALCNKLYKKELFAPLIEKKQMDRSIKINEDLLMNYYLFRQARLSVFEDVCLYHYMVRAGSTANSALNKNLLLDPLSVREIIMQQSTDIPAVYPLACKNFTRQLIVLSTHSLKENPSLIRPIRKAARKKLRHSLRQHLPLSSMYRIVAYWAAYFPSSYRFVHNIYAKAKGYDRLYEIK